MYSCVCVPVYLYLCMSISSSVVSVSFHRYICLICLSVSSGCLSGFCFFLSATVLSVYLSVTHPSVVDLLAVDSGFTVKIFFILWLDVVGHWLPAGNTRQGWVAQSKHRVPLPILLLTLLLLLFLFLTASLPLLTAIFPLFLTLLPSLPDCLPSSSTKLLSFSSYSYLLSSSSSSWLLSSYS